MSNSDFFRGGSHETADTKTQTIAWGDYGATVIGIRDSGFGVRDSGFGIQDK
jgi:hypothetical protein